MPRFLPVTMTALAVLASQAIGSFGSNVDPPPGDMSRELAIAPSGYGQVGQTLFGVVDSDGTVTGTSDVEFGSNVALSDDGLRMAVGASNHDWVSADNSGAANLNGGAVFIYDYDGTDWNYKTHIVGTPGEQLGKWPISLSSDGETIAIRRGGTQPRPSEVYRIETNGALTKLGDDITCSDGGNGMVSLTETSGGITRLAAGCPNDGAGTSGEVRILDWNTTDWVEVNGSPLALDGTSGVGFYGFDLAWAKLGTRLALSAPNYNVSLTEEGLVRVVDYDGSTWTQLGSDITGTQASEKLGFTMDLSSDGETLVIGSPNKDVGADVDKGSIQVYTLNTTDSTWTFEEEIDGSAASAKFGFGINVNNDGTLFCASTLSSYDSDRGQLRLFAFSSGSSATEVAAFEGFESGDKLSGVAMTDDGSRLALGSVGAAVNGIVQVFDDGFTPAPSLAPSASPSPTVDVPVNPNLTPFDWDIERLGTIEVALDADNDASEIKLLYNISLRDTLIQAFEDDCTTPIPPNVTTLTSELVNTSLTHGNFTVSVDLAQDNVTDSPIWEDVGVGEGLISMCLRVDLTLGDAAETSVSFYEQKLYVSVGLLQGFEVTGIDLNRNNATEETGSADFDYNVTACHCDAAGTCVNTVLTQGSDVYLCVETTAENVEIADIRELTMAQGAFNTTPIVAGVEDPLTEVTIDGKEATIRYQIISAFFADANPADIVASGEALLAFTDDNGRRLLRNAKVVPVQRELGGQEEGWVVRMEAESASDEPTSGAFACGISMMVIVVGGIGAMVF